MIAPTYYAVFYDIKKPKNISTAMYKRVQESTYNNLTDGFPDKQVELRNGEDILRNYRIINVCTFSIFNTIDNAYYCICDCEKV